ncbi:methylated-DNA--[protein]-cysteine S-methyltransferase [Paenibacillus sp. N3.4]|uniref:methylated-DNA--[protein]-cysteine S-methyltransferase n=1 Tax=Paenibacillus sp. N3.4 TaxID=2603222 RepID=UPI0011C8C59F|nr:methylated-DNA--[protein]-cysteine S-methyltransferase [Paenibacillus sp. N3.4]TXK80656.1 methylated-DNA--[protein]-cysteine S-methyltransferase [Paenibacillus sp. N3.4]
MRNNINSPIYWTQLSHVDWNIIVAATSNGLCYVGSQNMPMDELADWAKAHFPGCTLIEDGGELQPYANELIEYFQGKRKSFTIPFDFHGTTFQLDVWKALCEIPYGQTKSYSDIANQIQKPSAVRAVGSAIGANPVLITVPCHRVIGKNGALTGYRGGIEMKTKLLELEHNNALMGGDLHYA